MLSGEMGGNETSGRMPMAPLGEDDAVLGGQETYPRNLRQWPSWRNPEVFRGNNPGTESESSSEARNEDHP